MKLCIMCDDANVEKARENSKDVFTKSEQVIHPMMQAFKDSLPDQSKKHLSIPLSETGKLPATHWFCFVNVDDDGYQKLLSVQQHSIIEQSGPKEFLTKWNLQIIK